MNKREDPRHAYLHLPGVAMAALAIIQAVDGHTLSAAFSAAAAMSFFIGGVRGVAAWRRHRSVTPSSDG